MQHVSEKKAIELIEKKISEFSKLLSDATYDNRFDENYDLGFEDIDLCFKMRLETGKKIIYMPTSEIIHYEGLTRGTSDKKLYKSEDYFMSKYRSDIVIDADEFLNIDYKVVQK